MGWVKGKVMKKETAKNSETYSLNLIWAGSIITLIVLICAGAFLGSLSFVFGVLVGGIVAILNHFGLYRSLKGILSAATEEYPKRMIPFAVMGFYFRLLISGVIIFFALRGGWAAPIAIIIGASVVIINTITISIAMYFTERGA
jgi:hypothetical protein